MITGGCDAQIFCDYKDATDIKVIKYWLRIQNSNYNKPKRVFQNILLQNSVDNTKFQKITQGAEV
jgi:hypothetical protein